MECAICDDEFDPEETATMGLCGPCWDESELHPGGAWPTGVRWEDLPPEWVDYFTSRAYDWAPVCCDRVVSIHHTEATSGLCTVCGTMTG